MEDRRQVWSREREVIVFVLVQDAQFKVQSGSRKLIVGYRILVEIYIVDEISRVFKP